MNSQSQVSWYVTFNRVVNMERSIKIQWLGDTDNQIVFFKN